MSKNNIKDDISFMKKSIVGIVLISIALFMNFLLWLTIGEAKKSVGTAPYGALFFSSCIVVGFFLWSKPVANILRKVFGFILMGFGLYASLAPFNYTPGPSLGPNSSMALAMSWLFISAGILLTFLNFKASKPGDKPTGFILSASITGISLTMFSVLMVIISSVLLAAPKIQTIAKESKTEHTYSEPRLVEPEKKEQEEEAIQEPETTEEPLEEIVEEPPIVETVVCSGTQLNAEALYELNVGTNFIDNSTWSRIKTGDQVVSGYSIKIKGSDMYFDHLVLGQLASGAGSLVWASSGDWNTLVVDRMIGADGYTRSVSNLGDQVTQDSPYGSHALALAGANAEELKACGWHE